MSSPPQPVSSGLFGHPDGHQSPSIDEDTIQCLDFDFGLPLPLPHLNMSLVAQETLKDEIDAEHDEDTKLPSTLDETLDMIDATLNAQSSASGPLEPSASDLIPSQASKSWDKLRHQFLRSNAQKAGVDSSPNLTSTGQFRVLHPPNNKADKRTGALNLKPFNLDLTSLGLTNAIPVNAKNEQVPSSASAFKSKFTGVANLGGWTNPSSNRGPKAGPGSGSLSRGAQEPPDLNSPATQLLQTFASLSSLRSLQLSQGIPPSQIQLRILTLIADMLSRLKVYLPSLPSQRRLLAELSRPLLSEPIDIVACRLAMDIFIRLTADFKSAGETDELARWVFVIQALRPKDSITRKKALDLMHLLVQPTTWAPSGESALTSLVSALMRALIVFLGERSDTTNNSENGEDLESVVLQQLTRCSRGELVRIDPATFARNVGVQSYNMLDHKTVASLVTFKAVLDAANDFNFHDTYSTPYWTEILPRFWPSFHVLPSHFHMWYFRSILQAFSSLPCFCWDSMESLRCDITFTSRTHTSSLPIQYMAFKCLQSRHPPETLQSLPWESSSILIESVLRLLAHTSNQVIYREKDASKNPFQPTQTLAEQITSFLSQCPSEPIIAAIDSLSKSGSRTSLSELLTPLVKLIAYLSESQRWSSPSTSRTVGNILSHVVEEIEPDTIHGLSDALDTLRIRCPVLFYKPVFTCAASNAIDLIGRVLRNITTLSSLVGETRFWLAADPDMLAVALFGGLTKVQDSPSHWTVLKLGQMCLIVHLANFFKLTRGAEELKRLGNLHQSNLSAFGDAFETRLTALVGATESQKRLSPSARLLISALLMELRLLTRLPRRGTWMPRIVDWVKTEDVLDGDVGQNIRTTCVRLADLFRLSMKMKEDPAFAHASRVSRMSFTKVAESLSNNDPRIRWLERLYEGPQSYYAILLSLISACYSSLVDEDLKVLVALLFEVGLCSPHTKVLSASAFLIVQAAEKELAELTDYVQSRLLEDDPAVRLGIIQSLASLFSTRFLLLMQPLADQTRRKLFTAPKHQITYVPVEVGMTQWVPPDDEYHPDSLIRSTNISIETRRALEELGWDEDQKARQTAFERQRAPLAVLPLPQPHAGGGDGELPSRSNTPTPSLRRRSSAASMHDAFSKKQQRSVVTPATARLLMMASLLSHDKNTRVCVIARKLIMDLIRDESNAALRPFTEDLSGSSAEVGRALKMMRSMLEINYCLPPVFVHQLFSHLVGWSKSIARLSYRSDVFANMASALSIASAASIHVQQFNMRDVKRAKIEHMLLSHGQLWFVEPGRDRLLPTSSTANASSQLERLSIPRVLFDVTRTRIAQIRLMASYLKQQPKEAFNLRQHLHGCLLILPVDEGLPSPLENRFFLPRTDRQAIISAASDPDNNGLHSLSRVLALSWLDLLSQLFNGLTTATVAKQEFVELFDSINRILICHSDDVLTVSNCLKVCMQASTKFRRLFRVKGFAMFVPLVFKVYCEAKTCNFQVIMEAIAFAWKRWFICHGDAFIFQALAACAPVMTRPGVDEHAQKAMASSLFDLLTSLTANHTTAKRDIAALDGVNTAEEQAALSYLAKHRPELFVSNREGSSEGSHNHLAPLDENQTFELGDLCKLFFTAIAFDPTSDRSGSFIRLLSLLIPHLTRLPASSKILHEGVDALLKVYAKPLPKTGLGETSTNTDAVPVGQKVAYMGVVTAFVEAGGKLTDTAISRLIQLAFQIIRADPAAGQLTSMRFLCVYVQTHTHARGQSNAVKQPVMFLRETLTIFKDTLEEIDYSSFLECLQEFMESADLKSTALNGLVLLYVRYALGAHSIQYDLKVFSRDLRRSCARLSATIAKKSMLPSLISLHIDPSKPHALVDFLIPLALALPSDPTQATVSLESSWIMLIATAVKSLSADHFKTTRGLVFEHDRTLSFLLSIQLLKIALTKGFQALRANDVVWTHVADHLKSVLSSSAVSFISSLESQAWVIGAQEQQYGLPVIEYATWSVCEWLSRFPSPLMIGLKHLVTLNLQACRPFEQKVAHLGSDKAQTTVSSTRLVSSMYLPQRKLTPVPSPVTSPDPTPNATPVRPPARAPTRPQLLTVTMPKSPTWKPPSPSLVPIAGAPTKLRHLGLTRQPSSESFMESESPVLKHSKLTDRAFVLETVGRIVRLQLIHGKCLLDGSLIEPMKLDLDQLTIRSWGAAECVAEIERESEMINRILVNVGVN